MNFQLLIICNYLHWMYILFTAVVAFPNGYFKSGDDKCVVSFALNLVLVISIEMYSILHLGDQSRFRHFVRLKGSTYLMTR